MMSLIDKILVVIIGILGRVGQRMRRGTVNEYWQAMKVGLKMHQRLKSSTGGSLSLSKKELSIYHTLLDILLRF